MTALVAAALGVAYAEVGDTRSVLAKASGDGLFCGKAALIGCLGASVVLGLSGKADTGWAADAVVMGVCCLTSAWPLPVKAAMMTSPMDVSVTSSTTPLM